MATGKSAAFNFQNHSKFSTLPNGTMEVTQDMHIKMSKKIAQLTKVIYALNTRNDEHEHALQSLRDQHEEQLQQVYAETKAKVEDFQAQVSSQSDYRKQIYELEKSIAERDVREKEVRVDFEKYKRQVDDEKCKIQNQHREKVLELISEVREVKNSFQKELQLQQSRQLQQMTDKQGFMEQLNQKHALEIEQLSHKMGVLKNDHLNDKERLLFEHNSTVEVLKSDLDKLSETKKQVIADYEGKLNKAQAFYDNELKAMQDSQMTGADEQIRKLSEENMRLQKDFALQDAQLRRRLDDVVGQLSIAEDQISNNDGNSDELRNRLTASENENIKLETELKALKSMIDKLKNELLESERDLNESRRIVQEQSRDLASKSTEIGQLEAMKQQHETKIRHLMAEIDQLQDKVMQLEKTRIQLESKSTNEISQQSQHAEHLKRSLDDERAAKEKLKQKMELELESLHKENKDRQKQLTDDYQQKFDKLLDDHRNEVESLRTKFRNEKQSIERDFEDKFNTEKERSILEQSKIQGLMETVKSELGNKLDIANTEIARLEKIIADSEINLGSASSDITNLKSEISRLKHDVDTARNDLTSSKKTGSNLEKQLEKAERDQKAAMVTSEQKLKHELEVLSSQLNTSWKEKLRKECDELKRQLSAQTDAEKQAALERLQQMREDELSAAKSGWQTEINELTATISALRHEMGSQEQQYLSKIEIMREQSDSDQRTLREQMYAAAEEYAKKIQNLEELQREQMNKLISQKQREIEETEKRMLDKHIESTRAAMLAHESAMDALKDKTEKEKEKSLSELSEEHNKRIEDLHTEMKYKHSMEIDQYAKAHSAQMSAARMELDRAIEVAKQKETKFEIELSEFQDDLRRKEMCIENLENDIQTLHRAVDELGRDLETKGKEILKVRSEANKDLKRREDELQRSHKQQVDALSADHLRETENILDQFNRAQDLLKDKISSMQMSLEEAVTRFANRESRPEDIEMIAQLREAVQEREENLKRLNEEKRYFQLELVNRETNFNKVFSTSPNVGVMNPLSVKKRKGSVDKGKGSASSPSLNSVGKLQPLPGSPFHDERLNPVKPLPPPQAPQKQFVK